MARVVREVEVVGTGHAIAALDGTSLTQVAFGEIGRPAAQPVGGAFPPNASVASIWAVVFVRPDMNPTYPMGSKWRMAFEDDGRITVSPSGRPRRASRRKATKSK
jgi:hypothetical protein